MICHLHTGTNVYWYHQLNCAHIVEISLLLNLYNKRALGDHQEWCYVSLVDAILLGSSSLVEFLHEIWCNSSVLFLSALAGSPQITSPSLI